MNLKLLEEALLDFQKKGDMKNQRHSWSQAEGQNFPSTNNQANQI
jgi:hypothetical protein